MKHTCQDGPHCSACYEEAKKRENGNKSASVGGYKDLLPEEVQAEYDKACEFVDVEIVKAEGLGRAVEILKYERDNLWKYFKEKESL